jgi:hypothetical protein
MTLYKERADLVCTNSYNLVVGYQLLMDELDKWKWFDVSSIQPRQIMTRRYRKKNVARGKSHLPRYIFSSKYWNLGKSVRVMPCHIGLISVSDKERIVNNDRK